MITKSHFRSIILTLVALVSCSGKSWAIEISCEANNIRLSGTIEQGDLYQLSRRCPNIYRAEPNLFSNFYLFINSNGGDFFEAIKIGKWVRDKKISVLVALRCYSSCVLVLAAGVRRFALEGTVGIHRPYLRTEPSAGYDTALKNARKETSNYFYEMNVPERLAEEMFSTSPLELKILSNEELEKFQLNQNDMAYEEKVAVHRASIYGLSREEFNQRWKIMLKYRQSCVESINTTRHVEAQLLACANKALQRAGLSKKVKPLGNNVDLSKIVDPFAEKKVDQSKKARRSYSIEEISPPKDDPRP